MCEAKLGDTNYPAAVNIGVAPTIRNEDLTIEAFLLDFSGDIEGKEIELVFRQRLRSEIKLPTVQDLIAQIHRDVEATRTFFFSK